MPILGHYITLNRSNILYITTEEGVYEIFEDEVAIFLGSSEDDPRGIRGRLEKHLSGELLPGSGMHTMFRFETSSRPESKLTELLDEFEHEHGYVPKYNQPLQHAAAS